MISLTPPRGLPLVLLSLLIGLTTASCSSLFPKSRAESASPTTTITLSAAASLQDALDSLKPQFQQQHPNIEIDYNIGSSGSLQKQIEQGAPVDVFFAASTRPMDILAEKDLIRAESRQNLLTNKLVLIAPTNSPLTLKTLQQLKTTSFDHFAVGDFRSVPAGQYAEQVLNRENVLTTIQSKLIFGNSVRSTLTAVASGNAELGMVYATDAALSPQVKVLVTAPDGSHQPILYPIAIVKRSTQPQAAQTVIDFLNSPTAKTTFQHFGFAPAPQ